MNQNQLLALLASLAGNNAAPAAAAAPAPAGTPISGAIIVLPSGVAKIGDCQLRALPAGVQLVAKKSTKTGAQEYLQSTTVFTAVGHIGAHGAAYATDLVDTGAPVPDTPARVAIDFNALMAAAKGGAAPATGTATGVPTPNM